MRCLVLPCRIWRRVLYLSLPALTFSACSMSFCVFLVSSRASANSELRAWTEERDRKEKGVMRDGETLRYNFPKASLTIYHLSLSCIVHHPPGLVRMRWGLSLCNRVKMLMSVPLYDHRGPRCCVYVRILANASEICMFPVCSYWRYHAASWQQNTMSWKHASVLCSCL